MHMFSHDEAHGERKGIVRLNEQAPTTVSKFRYL